MYDKLSTKVHGSFNKKMSESLGGVLSVWNRKSVFNIINVTEVRSMSKYFWIVVDVPLSESRIKRESIIHIFGSSLAGLNGFFFVDNSYIASRDKSSRHDALLFKCLACDFNHTLESHLELGFATYHAPAKQVPVLEISTVETPCASSWYPSQCHGKIRVKINHSMILGRSIDTDGQFDHTAVLGTKATVRGYDKVSNFSRFDVEPEYNVTMSRVESIEGFVFTLHFTLPFIFIIHITNTSGAGFCHPTVL